MRKAVSRERVKVRCVGWDNETHAEGEMLLSVIEEASGVLRKGKQYRYVGCRDKGVLTFMEIEPPYVITEF